MIALGYPGEIDKECTELLSNLGLWGFLSTTTVVYILWTPYKHSVLAIKGARPDIGVLLRNAGLLALLTRGFYPLAFMASFYGFGGAAAEVTASGWL